MASPATKQAYQLTAEVIGGPNSKGQFNLDKSSILIGRSPDNDIVLSKDSKVSRKHLELKWINGQLYAINLSPNNFYLVDGLKGENGILKNNVILTLGESEIRITFNSSLNPLAAPSHLVPIPATPKAMSQNQHASLPVNPFPNQSVMSPAPYAISKPQGSKYSQSASNGSRVKFYSIISIIGLIIYLLFSGPTQNKNKDPNQIRTFSQIETEIKMSNDEAEKIREKLDKLENSPNGKILQRAEENFLKGFREYSSGNYNRAIESFQVTLNLNVDHLQARRYLNLSKLKLDEQVKQIMLIGNGYRQIKNWRRCQSSYQTVMTLLISRQNDATFKEAKEYYDECTLALRGAM